MLDVSPHCLRPFGTESSVAPCLEKFEACHGSLLFAARAYLMMDRRELVLGAFGFSSGPALSTQMANADSSTSYERAVHSTWAPMHVDPSKLELVRFATLAANSHNTQPWKFSIKENSISIAPDYARRCPVVDPDNHHLFVSLGCAAENLTHAAATAGLKSNPVFENDVVTIMFEKAQPIVSPLFEAIPHRHSTRSVYDGKPVSPGDVGLLEQAGIDDGVAVLIMTDRARMAEVTEYVVRGNSNQMQDKAFMKELKTWPRFSEADAVSTMDGLFSRASGNPSFPSWLARPLLNFVYTESGENDKYRAKIDSSAGIAVFTSELNDKKHWIAAGRACQRFALQATSLGLKYAFINQPVEVPNLRNELSSYLGLGGRRPDIVVRFGNGPDLPRSLRRPPEQLLL
jgi:hypothetical protein